MSYSWPETPFQLIHSTGIETRPHIPPDHYCRHNAQLMALTHNTMFRGLNGIYHQAPFVQPSTKAASDLLLYCTVIYDFIHEHHTIEENIYFPAIEAASGRPGLMNENVEQHHQIEIGLEAFQKYATETSASAYRPELLQKLIDDMAGPLETHLHEEIPSILDLYDKIDSNTMRKIYAQMHDEAERKSDKFKAGPFVLGSQDKSFVIDGEHISFPEVPSFVPYIVDWLVAWRHRGAWRFNSSDMYGNPKPFPSLEILSGEKSTANMFVKSNKSPHKSLADVCREWGDLLLIILLWFYVLNTAEVASRKRFRQIEGASNATSQY